MSSIGIEYFKLTNSSIFSVTLNLFTASLVDSLAGSLEIQGFKTFQIVICIMSMTPSNGEWGNTLSRPAYSATTRQHIRNICVVNIVFGTFVIGLQIASLFLGIQFYFLATGATAAIFVSIIILTMLLACHFIQL